MSQYGVGVPIDRFPVRVPPSSFNAPPLNIPTGVSADPSTIHRYHKQFPAPPPFAFYSDLLWVLPEDTWANCFELDFIHRSGNPVQVNATEFRPTWFVPDLYDVMVFANNSNVPSGANVGVSDGTALRLDDARVLATFQPKKECPTFTTSLAYGYMTTGVLSIIKGDGRGFSIKLPASQKFNQLYMRAWYLLGFDTPGLATDYPPFVVGRAWLDPSVSVYRSEV